MSAIESQLMEASLVTFLETKEEGGGGILLLEYFAS